MKVRIIGKLVPTANGWSVPARKITDNPNQHKANLAKAPDIHIPHGELLHNAELSNDWIFADYFLVMHMNIIKKQRIAISAHLVGDI